MCIWDINEEDKPIYYIGVSKYFKIGNQVSAESVYKQFTYARNVIQWNLNLFLDESKENKELQKTHPKYRDDRTEGYNVVPNFFISAKMDEKLSYADNISASDRKENTFLSRHFTNRLFDRDTLLVYHYDVNFLYVVSLYARENKFQKAQWKEKVRELFREKIQAALTEKYAFYAMRAKPGVDDKEYLETHFQQLLGKVYMPFQQYDDIYSLALDNDEKCQQENKLLLEQLEAYFFVEPCPLGHDPQEVLPKTDDAISRLLPANVTEKNVLTCLVRKGDSNYKVFENHAGKTYIMERVPNINLLGITYLLPMVGGCIDGYYDVNRMSIDVKDGVPVLRLRLGDYHALGASRVQIYRTKMQPGELISLEQTMKLYET